MNSEDSEFTRIEMESNARRLAVEYALKQLHHENKKLGLYLSAYLTQEERNALNEEPNGN